ncbi:MAG: geranylgeranyl reductase family protein [Ferruginibacter sp.]|nr:geranylgeranyl reductase family protein [Cytophagales bacterium]
MQPATHFTDVCILGAGPGGSAAALHLANRGIASVLLDKATFPRDKVCGDALSGKVVNELRRIDPRLVERLAALPTGLPSRGIHFFAPNLSRVSVPFKYPYDQATDQPPGYLVRRVDFDHFLVEEARQRPEIDFREGIEVNDFRREGGRITLVGPAGMPLLSTRLLIVANGAQSAFTRHHAGIRMEPEHHCAGLRAYYRGVKGLDADGFIELHFFRNFLPGYFWIFPLSGVPSDGGGGYANVGVGMLSESIRRQKINLKKAMLDTIAAHPRLRDRFAHAERLGDIRGYGLPLGSKQRPLSGDGFLLVGDAASLVDPFTGEGISNAMISGRWAATTAEQALRTQNFSASFLRTYDGAVYNRLGKELALSRRMQQLLRYPGLFNVVANRAARNPVLAETLSCMFLDLDLRQRLRQPSFYLKLLFNR